MELETFPSIVLLLDFLLAFLIGTIIAMKINLKLLEEPEKEVKND